MNIDKLALIIEQLSKDVGRRLESGPLSFQEVQRMTNSLTRAQLVLNELERIELRERGVSSDLPERFAALESSIRTMRDDLYRNLRRRTAPAPEGAGVAGKPAAGKDNEDAHDPAGR